jgi:hypothetical protein
MGPRTITQLHSPCQRAPIGNLLGSDSERQQAMTGRQTTGFTAMP